ncbi:hypothetical protein TNCV_158991 [Trichonephila clavipes]|uniref:Uncharacterized protein n=1 Tax=Trichonephila clavipes TaxID=2585209 RepID=A0A8X6UQ59_TRICX|nr:hypothetical protein TNCV_158991 [Trichonephila clavipes]
MPRTNAKRGKEFRERKGETRKTSSKSSRITEAAKPLIEFLEQTLNLTMNNDAREGTRYGTMIDAVFLIDYKSRIFISYFSYHTPIVSFLGNDAEKFE